MSTPQTTSYTSYILYTWRRSNPPTDHPEKGISDKVLYNDHELSDNPPYQQMDTWQLPLPVQRAQSRAPGPSDRSGGEGYTDRFPLSRLNPSWMKRWAQLSFAPNQAPRRSLRREWPLRLTEQRVGLISLTPCRDSPQDLTVFNAPVECGQKQDCVVVVQNWGYTRWSRTTSVTMPRTSSIIQKRAVSNRRPHTLLELSDWTISDVTW